MRVRVVDGLVERVLDDDPANPNAAAPLWVLGDELVPYLDGLSGPPYELSDAIQHAIDAGLRDRGRRDRPDPGLDASC